MPPARHTRHPRRLHSLSHGRPSLPVPPSAPTAATSAAPSSRLTRTTIRAHHSLTKSLSAALQRGDSALADALTRDLDARGGLAAYQAASLVGQSKVRGGDSSRVLAGWLREGSGEAEQEREGRGEGGEGPRRDARRELRVLEVGALSTRNAIGRVPGARVRRIDIRSVERGIEEVDFMEMEVPGQEEGETRGDGGKLSGEQKEEGVSWRGGYDVLSLSLVLNFVPSPAARGAMLRRTVRFLRGRAPSLPSHPHPLLPALFLVLPAPCVTNSRYLTEDLLVEMMCALGYVCARRRLSSRLAYYLWRWVGPGEEGEQRADGGGEDGLKEVGGKEAGRERGEQVGGTGVRAGSGRRCEFRKSEARSGSDRNNFCIVLEGVEVDSGSSDQDGDGKDERPLANGAGKETITRKSCAVYEKAVS